MSRGRKPRVPTTTLPAAVYQCPLAKLEAVRSGRITPTAAQLLDVIQAHAWQDGRCDLTDRHLGQWLGGLSERQVANLRHMLVAAGLLRECTGRPGANERWLIPYPTAPLPPVPAEGPDGMRSQPAATVGRSEAPRNGQDEGGIHLQTAAGEMSDGLKMPRNGHDEGGIRLKPASGEMGNELKTPRNGHEEGGIRPKTVSGEMSDGLKTPRNGHEEGGIHPKTVSGEMSDGLKTPRNGHDEGGIRLKPASGEMGNGPKTPRNGHEEGGIRLKPASGEMSDGLKTPRNGHDEGGIHPKAASGEMSGGAKAPRNGHEEGGIHPKTVSGEMSDGPKMPRNGHEEGEIHPKPAAGEMGNGPKARHSARAQAIDPQPVSGEPEAESEEEFNLYLSSDRRSSPGEEGAGGEGDALADHARLAAFLVQHGAFPGVATALAADLLGRMTLPQAQHHALALYYDVRAGGRHLSAQQIVGRWVNRLRDGTQPSAQARAAAGDCLSPLPAAAEPTPVRGPAICTLPDGQPADQHALWQAALDQLRLQMTRATYHALLHNSRCLAVAQAGAAPTLLVQVASPSAVAWLEARLQPLVQRTLARLTGRPFGVRFVAESPGLAVVAPLSTGQAQAEVAYA